MMSKYRLPRIDHNRTRDEVETCFDWYRLHKYLMDNTPNMTAMYPQNDAEMIRGNGGVHSTTETWAIKRADVAYELNRIEQAVKGLARLERDIITRRLMKEEPDTDRIIMDDLHVNHKKFYKVKADAYYRVALAIGIAVYLDTNNT